VSLQGWQVYRYTDENITVARGNSVLSKSITPERIKANLQIVKLDEDDMKILNDYTAELTKQGKLVRYVYPAFGVDFGFPDKS
jgi:diketogulonate reductase-like aldo/keto reductase